MGQVNTNQRRTDAHLKILTTGNFEAYQLRAFNAAHKIASVRAFAQADGYLKTLLAGKVQRRFRREFVEAVREALSTAKEFRMRVSR